MAKAKAKSGAAKKSAKRTAKKKVVLTDLDSTMDLPPVEFRDLPTSPADAANSSASGSVDLKVLAEHTAAVLARPEHAGKTWSAEAVKAIVDLSHPGYTVTVDGNSLTISDGNESGTASW